MFGVLFIVSIATLTYQSMETRRINKEKLTQLYNIEIVMEYKGKVKRYMIKNDIIVYLNLVSNAKYDKLYVNGKEVER